MLTLPPNNKNQIKNIVILFDDKAHISCGIKYTSHISTVKCDFWNQSNLIV